MSIGYGLFRGKFKGAFFQAFVEQDKAAGFPAQELDAVALFVDEDEYIPAHGVAPHLAGDNPAQPVKTLAHISGAAIQIISAGA